MLLGVSKGSAPGGVGPSSHCSGETTKAARVKHELRLLLFSFFTCLHCCYPANSDQRVRLESCSAGALLGAGWNRHLLMEMQVELVKGKQCCLVSKRPSHLQIKAPSPACFTPELGMPGLQLSLASARTAAGCQPACRAQERGGQPLTTPDTKHKGIAPFHLLSFIS